MVVNIGNLKNADQKLLGEFLFYVYDYLKDGGKLIMAKI